MALQLSLTDRFGNSYDRGYRRLSHFVLDDGEKTIRLIFSDYKDQDSYQAGRDPFGQVVYTIGPAAQPAILGEAPLITPEKPAVFETDEAGNVVIDGDGNPIIITPAQPAVFGPAPLISPEVDAVYGDPPLLIPAIPSYEEYSSQDAQNPSGIRALVYAFAKAFPENSQATDVL